MIISEYSIDAPFPEVRLVVAADLHDRKADDVLSALPRLRPDLVLVPGDLTTLCYTESTHRAAGPGRRFRMPEEALSFLRGAAETAPVYCSRGNHEWRLKDADIEVIEGTGAHFLEKSFVHEGPLVLGGLPSADGYGKTYKKGAVPDLSWLPEYEAEEGFHVLLCHNPEYGPKYLRGHDIELAVSGHAHGGQWRFFGRGVYAPGQGLFPKYTRGLYENGHLLVSAGLTNTLKPVPRINDPAELVLVRIGKVPFLF